MKTRKILIVALLLMSFSLIKCECAGDSACQITYVEGVNRVVCAGECPSADAPECYVRFRKAGSTDEWTKSGQRGMDKTPGMEFSCYCDSATAVENKLEVEIINE